MDEQIKQRLIKAEAAFQAADSDRKLAYARVRDDDDSTIETAWEEVGMADNDADVTVRNWIMRGICAYRLVRR